MGKSVFLKQMKAELERHPGTRVVLLEAPPPMLTVEACLSALARQLGLPGIPFDSRELFDHLFAREDVPERLVLLFDEFDRYVHVGGGRGTGRVRYPRRMATRPSKGPELNGKRT